MGNGKKPTFFGSKKQIELLSFYHLFLSLSLSLSLSVQKITFFHPQNQH